MDRCRQRCLCILLFRNGNLTLRCDNRCIGSFPCDDQAVAALPRQLQIFRHAGKIAKLFPDLCLCLIQSVLLVKLSAGYDLKIIQLHGTVLAR